jgi:hypothetical protein
MRPNATHVIVTSPVIALAVAGLVAVPSCAYTLFGGVAHSELVPPAQTRYPTAPLSPEVPQRGTVEQGVGLHPRSPTSQNPKIVWLRMPNWMAGQWTKQGDLTVSYTDLRTGVTTPMNQWTQDLTTATWGNQFDAQGNIWHGYVVPWERDGQSNGRAVTFLIVAVKPEAMFSNQLVGRVHSLVTERLGAQIVDAFQQESLNDYILLPSGEIENHSSNRDFTNEGQPIREGMLVSRYTKVGPFVPVSTLNGVDLLKSLNEYLRAHNMSHLVRSGP